jgi:hypothetical protein
MKTTKIIFALLLFSILISCSKKEEPIQLPTGENTAYYYLNGALVIPKGAGVVPPVIKPITYSSCLLPDSGLVLNFNNLTERLKLFIKPGITTTGTYTLSTGGTNIQTCIYNNNFGHLSIRGNNGASDTDYLTSQNSGELIITKLSTNKRQLSGTFKATLKDANGQSIEITGGVFDINLDTL